MAATYPPDGWRESGAFGLTAEIQIAAQMGATALLALDFCLRPGRFRSCLRFPHSTACLQLRLSTCRPLFIFTGRFNGSGTGKTL